jgi:hypothetical protein
VSPTASARDAPSELPLATECLRADIDKDELAEEIQRRRTAALRLPPLRTGRRDPLLEPRHARTEREGAR